MVEAMGTPTSTTPGGMTPAGTAPYPRPRPSRTRRTTATRCGWRCSSGSRRRWCSRVAWALTVKVGLPSWVVPGVGVLLALGFPIMMATGLAERRRAKARVQLTHTPKPEAGVAGC